MKRLRPFPQLLTHRMRMLGGPGFHPWEVKGPLVHGTGNYRGTGGAGDIRSGLPLPLVSVDFTRATLTDQTSPVSVATFTRASSATVVDYLGQRLTMDMNVPRFQGARWTGSAWSDTDPSGARLTGITLLLEPASTNYFLLSSAPATQTVSGRMGTHTVSIGTESTGSITLSGGLTGVVTAGTPVTGNPSGVDVLCTVSGSVVRPMFEPLTHRTSYIETAGAPVSRAYDKLSYAVSHTNVVYKVDGFLNHPSTATTWSHFGDGFRTTYAASWDYVNVGSQGYFNSQIARGEKVAFGALYQVAQSGSNTLATAAIDGRIRRQETNVQTLAVKGSVVVGSYLTLRFWSGGLRAFQLFETPLKDRQIEWMSRLGNLAPAT